MGPARRHSLSRYGRAAPAGVLLVAAALSLAACGAAEPRASPTVSTTDPAATFAPLVHLHPRERAFPMSAARFLAHAGLEWAGGPCGFQRDVSASATSADAAADPIPRLDPARLGREPAYRYRPTGVNCARPRPEVYSTAQRTRPFDLDDRPVGLRADEGFNLDILTDAQLGERRVDEGGALAGIPAYYAIEQERRGGDLRIGYWLLFGREEAPRGADDPRFLREGDWERIDVLLRRLARRDEYVPLAVEYRIGNRVRRLDWARAPLAGARETHPVARLDRGRHTPRPRASCRGCIPWRTWRRLRHVRDEPWWGYGGGWGAIGDSDESSGPSGPSPFDIGLAPE